MHSMIFTTEREASGAGAWVRALLGDEAAAERAAKRGMLLTRAQSEGVNSTGGFLVPEAMGNAIISLRDKYGVFRANAFMPPMQRDVVTWPRSLGNISGTWIGENGTASESTATFDNVSVIAKKLMVFIRASSELAD